MTETQEIHCHACGKYVQFPLDLSLDGNHVLECPVCGHEHCRVVRDGVITGNRWNRRNGVTHQISQYFVTSSSTSFSDSYITWTASSTSYTVF